MPNGLRRLSRMIRDFEVKTVTVSFGRRSGFGRRKPPFEINVIERRTGIDRRTGRDRRSGMSFGEAPVERERRTWLIKPVYN
jgi:hypothetical protein